MTTTAAVRTLDASDVRVDGDRLVVDHLVVDDPAVVSLAAATAEGDLGDLTRRLLAVGARGMTSMGIGIDLVNIDSRVQAVLETVTTEAEEHVRKVIDQSRDSLGRQFDPEQRSSILARALVDFTGWRDEFLARLDPAVEGSIATTLLNRLQALVGPEGALERVLGEALDLDTGDSALARLSRSIDERFAEMRRDLAGHHGAESARRDEAERGTAHGIAFEDIVESSLRRWAATSSGTFVERTTTTAGNLGAASKVGDFVVTLGSGRRVVVEAKRHASITLTGTGGILAELDAAMANRAADAAICVAGRDAFPTEVGRFNVYGNRILVVDEEPDGTMTAIAMQWAASATTATSRSGSLDRPAISDRIDRIRKAADSLSGARRTVTTMRTSLDKLHDHLGGLRSELLDHVGDLDRLVCPTDDPENRGHEGFDS